MKLCGHAPYPVWVNANGHEWAKRQLEHAGVGYRELDNGLRGCDDPVLARRICARLAAGHLRAALRRWMSWIPSPLETAVITRDVDPQIQIRYKSNKVKAYFKEQRTLRVETTINNPDDFGVKRRLTAENWTALRRVGSETNARFLAALGEGEHQAPDTTTLEAVVLPSVSDDGLRAPGLRFGDPRVVALLGSVASFTHVVGGLTNAGLCRLMQGLFDPAYTPRRATYDLTRLRRKGFIERVEGTHTYRVTSEGRRVASFFTKLTARVVVPVLTELETQPRPRAPAPPPIVLAWRDYERELERLIAASGLAA